MLLRLSVIVVLLPLLLSGKAAYSQASAPYPTAKLTVSGSETQPGGVWDSGNITIDFNGYVEVVNYWRYSNPSSLASALAAMFTRDFSAMGLYAKAGANGPLVDPTVITFQLVNGNTFAPINIVDASPSFSFSASGFASTSATVADRGTATLTVAGTTVTANYGDGSTAATIAQDLALKANSSLVTVTAEGANLYLQSKQTTGSFNYPYSLTFSTSTSFSSSPATGTLTASTDTAPVAVYSYSVTNSSGTSGYDGTGNILNVTDSVMGTWSYRYDTLNRLTSGAATTGPYAGRYTCWIYDSFGNRKIQSVSTTPCTGNPPATFSALYSANNQISSVSAPAGVSITYDAAGNVTDDGYNSYTYDAEGRVCALNGPQGMIGYQYDADGARIGKGSVTNWQNCDITSNGYTPTTDYVLDQGGGQMTEVAVSSGTWTPVHVNVTANGMLFATFDNIGWHFHLNDALGSRRAQTDLEGFPEQMCQNLPFGDQLYCTGSLTSPTEHHFTGKERDQESGLDYFGARYYGSNMGRFMSPDWSNNPEPVPYANFENPQSLNLYSYAANNPMSSYDLDGHCDTKTQDVVCIIKSIWNWLGSSSKNAQTSGLQATSRFVTTSAIMGMNAYSKTNTYMQQHPTAARAAGLAGDAGMIAATDGLGEVGVATRALTAADLGVEGGLTSLNGTIGVKNGIATVRIDYIAGEISNSFEVISSLIKVAEGVGATELRIEGTLANERLANILTKRYGMTSSGATDVIKIALKK